MKVSMKTSVLAVGAILLNCAILCQQSQAVPITGSVNMAGSVTLDDTDLDLATEASSFGTSFVTSGSGAYAGTVLSSVSWTVPFSWNPPNTPIDDLWTFVSGARTYTFDLSTITIVSQDSSFLNLTGTGTLQISGVGPVYDDTFGTFAFTIADTDTAATATFGFSSSNTALPDGGTTMLLLGSALLGIGALRRKLLS